MKNMATKSTFRYGALAATILSLSTGLALAQGEGGGAGGGAGGAAGGAAATGGVSGTAGTSVGGSSVGGTTSLNGSTSTSTTTGAGAGAGRSMNGGSSQPDAPNTNTPGIIGTGASPSGLPGDDPSHPRLSRQSRPIRANWTRLRLVAHRTGEAAPPAFAQP
jgi:hypothetical protein